MNELDEVVDIAGEMITDLMRSNNFTVNTNEILSVVYSLVSDLKDEVEYLRDEIINSNRVIMLLEKYINERE